MRATDRRRTVIKCVDDFGIWHDVVWMVGVANVLRCTGELVGHRKTGSIAGNVTTCLLCLGSDNAATWG